MIGRLLFCSLVFLLAACARGPVPEAAPAGYVVHPQPSEPKYLSANFYDDLKKKIPPPPGPNTLQQRSDEARLLEAQNKRTAADCERANADVVLSLKGFFGGPALLSDAEVAHLEAFLGQLRNDADYFIQRLKVDFPRKRPFLYVDGLQPCVPKEVTNAYPSGHAAIARLQALVLSRIYPERSAAFYARAKAVGESRLVGGLHHPSDIAAGAKVAELLYGELQKSEKFRAALSSAAK